MATIYANVRKGRPLYILSDGTSHMLLFAYMIAAGARRPLLIRIRGDNWDAMGSEASELRTFKQNLRAALQRHIDNFVFPKAALILSVSGHLQSIVQLKFHLSTEKLAVVNVPLTNNGQPVPCLPAPSDTSGQTILVVTNFEYWQKCGAIFDFMDDIVAFFEKYGEAKIAIVGDGTHLARMKREFSKFPISDHVVFLGKIHDMSTVYSTANAFLHLTYLDAFPNVIVEAQAMGLPTVINNFGGSVEALTAPGGVVVNQNARGELFNALDDIFANPADAASRAAISRAETLRRFSPPAIAASFRQTVDERLAPTR